MPPIKYVWRINENALSDSYSRVATSDYIERWGEKRERNRITGTETIGEVLILSPFTTPNKIGLTRKRINNRNSQHRKQDVFREDGSRVFRKTRSRMTNQRTTRCTKMKGVTCVFRVQSSEVQNPGDEANSKAITSDASYVLLSRIRCARNPQNRKSARLDVKNTSNFFLAAGLTGG